MSSRNLLSHDRNANPGASDCEEAAPEAQQSAEFPQKSEKERRYFFEEEEDKLEVELAAMPDDLYGAAMESLIRDVQMIQNKSGALCLRQARILATMALLVGVVVLQLFLLAEIKMNITAKAVRKVRSVYSDYEHVMYDGSVKTLHTGFWRGLSPNDFDAARFYNDSAWLELGYDKPELTRDTVCQIPFSQPLFLGAVLLLWTFSCLLQVVQTLRLLGSICATPDVDSIVNSIEVDPENPKELIIAGLPPYMKASLGLILFLQCGVTLLLLWLGCRWLSATTKFSDLVLNAVALEFILLLKETVYAFLVPDRNKREVRASKIAPWHGERFDHSGWVSFLGRIGWLIVSVLWVVLYIEFLQQVLPQYNWDVHLVCDAYIKEHYKINK